MRVARQARAVRPTTNRRGFPRHRDRPGAAAHSVRSTARGLTTATLNRRVTMANSSTTMTRAPGARPVATFPSIQAAHIDLIGALAVLKPHAIIGNADAADLHERADHLREVFRAVTGYVNAVITDTADSATATIDRKEIAAIMADSAADIIGAVARAAIDLEVAA